MERINYLLEKLYGIGKEELAKGYDLNKLYSLLPIGLNIESIQYSSIPADDQPSYSTRDRPTTYQVLIPLIVTMFQTLLL